MSKVTFFLICIFNVSCVDQENRASLQTKTVSAIEINELNKNSSSTRMIRSDSISTKYLDKYKLEKYDRKEVFKHYRNIILTNLKHGKTPIFLYNKCLDYDNIQYCYLGSHDNKSLRYDLIMSLTKEEISKILSIARIDKLKLKCELDINEGLPFFKKSNYELLISQLSDSVININDNFAD
jgi:hypothetical protein